MFRYIKNHTSKDTHTFKDPLNVETGLSYEDTKKKFPTKQKFKEWEADPKTESVFYTLAEGDSPTERISKTNEVVKISGAIFDYDAPAEWEVMPELIQSIKEKYIAPTYISKTYSNYIRTVFLFEKPIFIPAQMYEGFMKKFAEKIGAERHFAGFDSCSYKASQTFHFGWDWKKVGDLVEGTVYKSVLFDCGLKDAPSSGATAIPLEKIYDQIQKEYPNKWTGDFQVGSRGPLFWVEPFKASEGCQVTEDGLICYSTRAEKAFVSWVDLFGKKFVKEYETQKFGVLYDEFWYNGKNYYTLDEGFPVTIPENLLALELRSRGFSLKNAKGKSLNEVEAARLAIAKHNRVTEVAPCLWNEERVVRYNSNKILNSSSLSPILPSETRDPSKCSFSLNFLEQLFDNGIDHFFAWWQRAYLSILNKKKAQGQCFIIVGETNKGKTLLSNKFIGDSMGGFADASDYIAGNTSFNKELAAKAIWVVDDTLSAASFQDQRKATEINKRIVANPKIEYNAKYCDPVTVPWTGRIIMSANLDANSLSVIPALDSSNSDKIMALLVSKKATSNFPPNEVLEATIREEMPYLLRELVEMTVPPKLKGSERYGIKGYIDPLIADAAYDNSSRSSIAELIDWFCKHARSSLNVDNIEVWHGTLTELQSLILSLNDGRHIGLSHNQELLRRGMHSLEEASFNNTNIRPVRSHGKGGGKLWSIDLDCKYDLGKSMLDD